VRDCGFGDDDIYDVQEFMREVVLTSNHLQKVREFFGTFVEQIVVGTRLSTSRISRTA
jgi:hypothetical protein